MGYTASFLPKPVVGVNGSGRHPNMSISEGKTNLFWDEKGTEKLSAFGWQAVDRILTHGWTLPHAESEREFLPAARSSL